MGNLEILVSFNNLSPIITLIGIILSSGISIWALIVGYRNSKRTIFINSVTSSRIKYIQDLRNSIAEYCGLVYTYHANKLTTGSPEAIEIQKRYDTLKYLIGLHLNVEDDYFDPKILEMMKSIRDLKDKSEIDEVEKRIEPLILIVQYLLKLEWEGAKKESQRGMLSKRIKKNIYKKHIVLYEEHSDYKPILKCVDGYAYLGNEIRLTVKNEGRFIRIEEVNIDDNELVTFDKKVLPLRIGAGEKQVLTFIKKNVKGIIQPSSSELEYSFDLILYDNLDRKYKVIGNFTGREGEFKKPIRIKTK